MNCDVSKFSNPTSNNKSFKKTRRKRRRNKYKNSKSKLKRKFQKKFPKTNSTDSNHFFETKRPQYSEVFYYSNNTKVMSNWYWSNYKKAVEWQNKHKIAQWKACALGLQEENRYLLKIINSINPGMCPDLPLTMQDLGKTINKNKKCYKRKTFSQSKVRNRNFEEEEKKGNEGDNEDNEDEEEGREESELEFEMSEEMIKFFEESFKHKMDLQKEKEEKQQIETEKEVQQIQTNKLKRMEEMRFLYGEGAPVIIGMETAVQLSFDRCCDLKSPKYWPNIPLRL